jgi:hypothetical protein
MNRVIAESADEYLWDSGSFRRTAADVVLPHTYAEPYGKLRLAVRRSSVTTKSPDGPR